MPDGSRHAPSIAHCALALVGTPFRLHGRRPETGLDCVGLCLCALRGAGHNIAEPGHYTLRGASAFRVEQAMAVAGFAVALAPADGDLLLGRTGPMQLHLMIAANEGMVHAHAGLGRVVHMPGAAPWPIIGRWAAPPVAVGSFADRSR